MIISPRIRTYGRRPGANERSVSTVCCPRNGSDSSLLARNEHRARSKRERRRLSERNRIPPGVRKVRQEQQNVENLADFSFPHSNFILR